MVRLNARHKCVVSFCTGAFVALACVLVGLRLSLQVNIETGRMRSRVTLFHLPLLDAQHPPTAFSAYTDVSWRTAPTGWHSSWSYSMFPPRVSHARGASYQTAFADLGDRLIRIEFDQAQNVAKSTLARIRRGDELRDIRLENETVLHAIEREKARPSRAEEDVQH